MRLFGMIFVGALLVTTIVGEFRIHQLKKERDIYATALATTEVELGKCWQEATK
jgi:hypothetical protein